MEHGLSRFFPHPNAARLSQGRSGGCIAELLQHLGIARASFQIHAYLILSQPHEVICACRELLISAATFSMIASAGVAYMPSSVAVPGAEANSSATELLSVASGISEGGRSRPSWDGV